MQFFKKTLLVSVALISLFWVDTVVLANKTYTDINADHEFYISISDFTEKGIVEGYSDGTFRPNQPINRVEALKVILTAFGIEEEELPIISFPDAIQGEWYYEYIQKGVKNNIVEGYIDGTFKPANQVLFSESVKMALVAKGYNIGEFEYIEFHPSVTEEDWFYKFMSLAYSRNFISLEQNGSLNPNRPMNRGEFVDLIYKISSTEKNESFDITKNWTVETTRNGIRIEVPFAWQYYTLGEGVFLGFFAGQNPSFVRNVQNGARISINFWQNEENRTATQYFERIRLEFENEYRSADIQFLVEEKVAGQSMTVFIPRVGIYNLYIYLDNNNLLVAEGAYDSNSLKVSDLIKEIEKIYEKIEHNPQYNLSATEKLNELRKFINVEKAGKQMINLFNDAELIFTDTMGLGTGPIDYYYLQSVDQTVKYERSFDVIVDVLNGKNCEIC